jgi:hydrogenase expression/formation protein HypE
VVNTAIAENYVQTLRELPEGKNAKIIGKVVENHPRQVILESNIGGKRVVNMPIGEQLPRIC